MADPEPPQCKRPRLTKLAQNGSIQESYSTKCSNDLLVNNEITNLQVLVDEAISNSKVVDDKFSPDIDTNSDDTQETGFVENSSTSEFCQSNCSDDNSKIDDSIDIDSDSEIEDAATGCLESSNGTSIPIFKPTYDSCSETDESDSLEDCTNGYKCSDVYISERAAQLADSSSFSKENCNSDSLSSQSQGSVLFSQQSLTIDCQSLGSEVTVETSPQPTPKEPTSILKKGHACKSNKGVSFQCVRVFYFERAQGFTCVPSQGGSTLGMHQDHWGVDEFGVGEYQKRRQRQRREIIHQHCQEGKLVLPAEEQEALEKELQHACSKDDLEDGMTGNCRTTEEVLERGEIAENGSLEDDDDEETDSKLSYVEDYYFLQPVSIKQRRSMLRDSGSQFIDHRERVDCQDIRLSREMCGCDCADGICHPETCSCALNNIQCQVDRANFPCSCVRPVVCHNPAGRLEFNPLRVRTHFIHTQMRLEMEKQGCSPPGKPDDVDVSSLNTTEKGSCKDCQNKRYMQVMVQEFRQSGLLPPASPPAPLPPSFQQSPALQSALTPAYTHPTPQQHHHHVAYTNNTLAITETNHASISALPPFTEPINKPGSWPPIGSDYQHMSIDHKPQVPLIGMHPNAQCHYDAPDLTAKEENGIEDDFDDDDEFDDDEEEITTEVDVYGTSPSADTTLTSVSYNTVPPPSTPSFHSHSSKFSPSTPLSYVDLSVDIAPNGSLYCPSVDHIHSNATNIASTPPSTSAYRLEPITSLLLPTSPSLINPSTANGVTSSFMDQYDSNQPTPLYSLPITMEHQTEYPPVSSSFPVYTSSPSRDLTVLRPVENSSFPLIIDRLVPVSAVCAETSIDSVIGPDDSKTSFEANNEILSDASSEQLFQNSTDLSSSNAVSSNSSIPTSYSSNKNHNSSCLDDLLTNSLVESVTA